MHIYKFGGTLVNDEESCKKIIEIVKTDLRLGLKVIIIVSALGRFGDPYATDTLLNLATEVSSKERDRMLSLGEIISSLIFSSKLNKENISSYALSNEEIGIITDDNFHNGTVKKLDGKRMKELLTIYDVLIVPGFQGRSESGNIVTLGRGGSDMTALSVASMLNINEVFIAKDVGGIYSADPKIDDSAVFYDEISYDYLIELKSKVLQLGAIKFAKENNIIIKVFSLLNDKYTVIKDV